MSSRARSGGIALVVIALTAAVSSAQQAVPAGPNPAAAAPRTSPTGRPDEVLATVNGAPITRAAVLAHLSHFTFPPGKEKEVYDEGLDYLINVELLKQFLRQQKVPVTDQEIDAEVARLTRGSGDLDAALKASNTTMPELRARHGLILQWKKYFTAQGTPAALRRFVEENKDEFNGTRVRASHILVKVDPSAPPAEKEKARQRLLAIKREIDSGRMTFAAAADKYSEDDGNVATKSGGDLGYFPRSGQFIEEFAAVAFALKPGVVSEPVLTDFGYHLILVTDRKEGTPINFDQYRDRILEQFGFDLQSKILAEQRKTAKIDKEPMPTDFFPPIAAQPTPAEPR
ncbi:MAG TPA: peptidylprolyl isomerase [Isosphaeraceae bacterium]